MLHWQSNRLKVLSDLLSKKFQNQKRGRKSSSKHMNKKVIDYQEQLLQDLQDPKEAIAYLNAALMDEDPRIFLLALKNVIAAQGKMSSVAKKTKLNREKLYRMLSAKGNPKLMSIVPVLNALGLHLAIQQNDKR